MVKDEHSYRMDSVGFEPFYKVGPVVVILVTTASTKNFSQDY